MGVSGNSNVVKSFQSFMVNDGLLAKVVEAVKAGEKEARSTGDVQSFEVFYKGFRQNICIGRIYVVPASVCSDRKNFPVALLYGTVVREFHGEELADLVANKIGDSEFDEYSKADFDRIKETLFGTGEGKFESIVLFAPSWANIRDYVCFKFTKDDEKLTNLVRHLVFSAYYNPAVSSGFDALMTDFNTSKLDITDVTPKLSYPGITENPLNAFPTLEKQANNKKKIFLTAKTADEITKEVLDPQELDVFESLDTALTNALMPQTVSVEDAGEFQGEGGFTAPTEHDIPEVHVDAAKQACAPHETPFTNVGPGTSAAEAQETMVDGVKEGIEKSEKANPIEGGPIGIPVDEAGVPRREEEERKVSAVRSKIPGQEHMMVEYKTVDTTTVAGLEEAEALQADGWQINGSGLSSIQLYRMFDPKNTNTKQGATKIPTGKKADWDSFGHNSHPGSRKDSDIINNLKHYAWGQAEIPLNFGDRKKGLPSVKKAGDRDSLSDFERAYIEAALWSSNDESSDPMDSNYDIEDISPEAIERIRKDCAEFQKAAAPLLEEAYQRPGYNGHGEWSSEQQAGHDFWLTRNGHGAGFWDREALEEGGLGDKLTEVAKHFGECDLYIGDDQKVHIASAGAKLDASYIADKLATQVADYSEPMSSKAKAARNKREAQLDQYRKQAGVVKRADVALTFDEIWNSATEDFGAAPEVQLPGEGGGESNSSLPEAMTSEKPEQAKAITEGEAESQEKAFESAAPAFKKKKEAPKKEEAPTFEKKKEEPEAEEPKKEESKAEEKEEEPKEASSSKQADMAQRRTCPKCGGSGQDKEATRTMREREPSLAGRVRCSYCNGNGWEPADGFNFHEKGADQKQAGKIQDRINELEAIIKPHLISVENGAEPQLDENGKAKEDLATCGTCGMTWNDALMTGRTPAPSARCPYEYYHPEILELKKLKRRLHQASSEKHPCRSCGKSTEYNFCSQECAKKNNEDMSKGDYASPEDMKARTAAKQRVHCDQCQMLSINGVPCHETGCPNSKKRWDADRQEWVRWVECSECGEEIPEDDAERHAEEHFTVEEEPLEDDGMDDEEIVEASTESSRIDIKVTFEDGNSLETGFNGTLEDAKDYYMNNEFNFGDTEEHPKDRMTRAVSVEQIGGSPDKLSAGEVKCSACESGIHGECSNINPTGAKHCECTCYVNQEHKQSAEANDSSVGGARAKYEELMAKSNEEHRKASDEARKHENYEQYQQYVTNAWALSEEAMTYFNQLSPEEQQEIRGNAYTGMAEGFVRGLHGGPKQSAMGDENAETVKMDFGMGDLADIVLTEDETPVEGDDKENGGKTAESKKMCKRCHKNPVAPGTSSSLCKSCHEDSMYEAEKAQGVE